MSDQPVFKAITRFPMDPVYVTFIKSVIGSKTRSQHMRNLHEFVDSKLAIKRVELLNSGRAELEEQQRADHLLNVYLEWDKATYEVTAIYVFSDRDTALMFKLALN